jgi:uncharacterized protein
METVPAYEAGNDKAGMFFEMDYYGHPSRGAVRSWKNEMSPMTWVYWLTFDGLRAAGEAAVPALFVHGDGCVLPGNARAVFERLPGPKRMVWTDGSQTDFYDQQPQVGNAVAAAHEHFAGTLRARSHGPGRPDSRTASRFASRSCSRGFSEAA